MLNFTRDLKAKLPESAVVLAGFTIPVSAGCQFWDIHDFLMGIIESACDPSSGVTIRTEAIPEEDQSQPIWELASTLLDGFDFDEGGTIEFLLYVGPCFH